MKYTCPEEQFLKDVESHGIEIIRDEGINRHIRFRRPGTICYGFDLITWPGHLCITGDCGSYLFARIPDMFEFFRFSERYKKQYPNRKLFINQGYWAEKVLAVDKTAGIQRFSERLFHKNVASRFGQWCLDNRDKKPLFKAIWDDIRYRVLGAENEYEAYSNAMSFHSQGFIMPDFWEANCKEYTYSFEWNLFAIVWGIEYYDREKGATKSE